MLSFTTPALSDKVFTLVFLKRCFGKAEAPVEGKLGVACDQEERVQTVVELVHDPPGTIPEHKRVIVLVTEVITIQVHTCFPNSVVEEMMHVAGDCAPAFAG